MKDFLRVADAASADVVHVLELARAIADDPSPWSSLLEGENARQELAGLLLEHAVLRDQLDAVATYLPVFPRPTALGYASAWAFAQGDASLSQIRLDELFGAALRGRGEATNRRAALPHCRTDRIASSSPPPLRRRRAASLRAALPPLVPSIKIPVWPPRGTRPSRARRPAASP